MATDHRTSTARPKAYAKRSRKGELTAGGATGNERLTATVGAVLLALLAVLGVTILRIHGLLSVHLFVGLLLIPPIGLKLASTGFTSDVTGRAGRVLSLSGALVAGVVLAIVLIPEYSSWLNNTTVFLHHHH